ncbi:MAG: cation diffusion facilitator family transporter [Candidatus Omnitrophica bacterium]|nr:cation diffusion facilitator family transporter [Candidatus Omnitrophota bacterium]MCM8790782.1 cation diffusion facilitator family transporter [Candidatus Omnitrophota bacterium]
MSVQQSYRSAEKGSLVSLAVNGALFVFKMFAGIAGNSNAMIADALDTLGDSMTSTGMLVGFKIAKRPADADHPYGHGKAESIIAKLLAIFLIVLGVQMAARSIHIFISHTIYIPSVLALVAAVVSIMVKIGLFQYTNVLGRKISSTAMTVYSWNIAADVFSSTAALIGIAGARMGWPLLDPIAAFIISLLVIRTGFEGFHRAYDELMDGAPSSSTIEGIKKIAVKNKDIKKIKDIKVRKMGLDLIIDMTIAVNKDMTVEKGHDITDVVRADIIKKIPSAKEVFIHVEPF